MCFGLMVDSEYYSVVGFKALFPAPPVHNSLWSIACLFCGVSSMGKNLKGWSFPSPTSSRGRAVISQSVQRWATGWTIGVPGFDSRRGLGIFLQTTPSRTALGPTQPPIQWVPGALSLGVKRPRREADHSPPSSAEVKEWVELYIHSPSTPSWRCAELKHRDNFTFTSSRGYIDNCRSIHRIHPNESRQMNIVAKHGASMRDR
jgi:hypothetical protein